MPVTGGLNIIKQNLGNDRLDTFIYALSLYYDGNDSFIMSKNYRIENLRILKDYLDSYKVTDENGIIDSKASLYNYCNYIYHMDKELVDAMCCLGKRMINTPEDVNEYLNLVKEYWDSKS